MTRHALRTRTNELDHAMPLVELLRVAAAERRTFSLTVRSGASTGKIYVSVGEVVHAVYMDLVGDEAITFMSKLPDMTYRLPGTARPVPRALLPAPAERALDMMWEDDEDDAPPGQLPLRVTETFRSSRPPRHTLPNALGTRTPPALPSDNRARFQHSGAIVESAAVRENGALRIALVIGIAIIGGVAAGLSFNALTLDRVPAGARSEAAALGATRPTVQTTR